jgi:lambda family phage portal protein
VRRPSLFDRALGALGLSRVSRATGRRSYAGAQVNRLTQDWIASILSADQELKGDLRRLRGASRSLVRDSSYAARFVTMVAENVIGPVGIRLQAQATTTRDTAHTAFNKKLETGWKAWSAPENASADTRQSWAELQQLIARTLPQDGEVFLRLIPGIDNAFGFAVQLLDADQCDETYCVARGRDGGNEIRMGVEVNRYGKPLAYHMWTEHPSEFGTVARRVRERVPAESIIHLFRVLRPGQTRGVPWFAPILLDQKMMQAYQEAEITAARIGASNVAAVAIPDPEKFAGDLDEVTENGGVPMDVEPGDYLRLRPGEVLQSTDFGHPSTAFGVFTKAILRSIATGLGVSYMSLSGDLEAANYSSMRGGLLAERDMWRTLQEWVATHCHRRVFAAWLPHAALYGHLPARDLSAATVDAVRWLPRGWAWVDPVKDLEAAVLGVQHGFDTRTSVCAEQGADFEENLARLKVEAELAKEAGIEFPAPAGAKPTSVATGAEDTTPPTDSTDTTTSQQKALRLTRAAHV